MNGRLILFSAIVTAAIGAGMGWGLAQIRVYNPSYRLSSNSLHRSYIIAGTGIGFLIGAGLESIRGLKEQQDREEKLRDYIYTYLSLRDIEHKLDE